MYEMPWSETPMRKSLSPMSTMFKAPLDEDHLRQSGSQR